jgi:hypothetical protein
MIENAQEWSETVMKRSGMVNGQERLVENGHDTVTLTHLKR